MNRSDRKKLKSESQYRNYLVQEFLTDIKSMEKQIAEEPDPADGLSEEELYARIVAELKRQGKWKE